MIEKCDFLWVNDIINKILGTNEMVKIHNIRRTKLVTIFWTTNPHQAGLIREEESNDFHLPFYIILTTFKCPNCNKIRFEPLLYPFSCALCLFPREV